MTKSTAHPATQRKKQGILNKLRCLGNGPVRLQSQQTVERPAEGLSPVQGRAFGRSASSVSLWKHIRVEAHPTSNETLGGGKTFLFIFFLLGSLTSPRKVMLPLARFTNEL